MAIGFNRMGMVILVCGAAIAPAQADKMYAALDHGKSALRDLCAGNPAACTDNAFIYRIAGGFQYTPAWAVEISYGDYGKASAKASADWHLSGLQLAAIGTLPIADGFSLLGKLGAARTELKLTGTAASAVSTRLAYGIGAQYRFTQSVDVRAQYENLGTVGEANITGSSKVTLLSAGVVLKY